MPVLTHGSTDEKGFDPEVDCVMLSRRLRSLWLLEATEERIEDDGDGVTVLKVGVGPVGVAGMGADWIDVVSKFLDDSVPFLGDAARAGEVFTGICERIP